MNLGATIFCYLTTINGMTAPQFELSYPGTRFRVSYKEEKTLIKYVINHNAHPLKRPRKS